MLGLRFAIAFNGLRWWCVSADAIKVRQVPAPTLEPDLKISMTNDPDAVRPGEAFTIDRTYTIANQGVSSDFTIAYYRSTDGTLDGAGEVLLGTETITAAADKLLGVHAGTSPSFRITETGSFFVLAKIDYDPANPGAPNGVIAEANEADNVGKMNHRLIVDATPQWIVDNLDLASYAETGAGWYTVFGTDQAWYRGQGRNHGPGSSDTATWTLAGLAPGPYEIQVRWSGGTASYATGASFTILDQTGPDQWETLWVGVVNQQVNPNDEQAAGVWWESLGTGTFTVTSGTLKVQLGCDAAKFVSGDAIRVIDRHALQIGALDLVQDDGVSESDYVTSDPRVTGIVTGQLGQQGNYAQVEFDHHADGSVDGHAAVTLGSSFTYDPQQFEPTLSMGSLSLKYRVVERDSSGQIVGEGNWHTFSFVSRTAILDNLDSAYSDAGNWCNSTLGTPGPFRGDSRWHAPGNAMEEASWTLGGLEPGIYEILATWSGSDLLSPEVPYTILDGTTVRGTVRVNQQINPNDEEAAGTWWESLGCVTITTETFSVEVSPAARWWQTGADAIRVKAAATGLSPDLRISLTGDPDVVRPGEAFAVDRTYTIESQAVASDFTIAYYSSTDGDLDENDILLGTETITAESDKLLGTHSGRSPSLGAITLAGEYFIIAKIDYDPGDPDGVIAEVNEEEDNEGTLSHALIVSHTPQWIIDTVDPGYLEDSTGWQPVIGPEQAIYGGFGRYHEPGTGADKATWRQTGLAPGKYQVLVSWAGGPAYSDSAPYRIFDGQTLLTADPLTVDQEGVPQTEEVLGFGWQSLGIFTVGSGTLIVELQSTTEAYVSADAVRIIKKLPDLGIAITDVPNVVRPGEPFTIERTYTIAGHDVSSNFNIAYYYSPDEVFGDEDDVLLGTETITAEAHKLQGEHVGASPGFRINEAGDFHVFAQIDQAGEIDESDDSNNLGTLDYGAIVRSVRQWIADDLDAAYSDQNDWPIEGNAGAYRGGSRRSEPGPEGEKVTWTVTGLDSGTYEILATWTASTGLNPEAIYTIKDGTAAAGTVRGTVLVNQQTGPNDEEAAGLWWKSLGHVTVQNTTLTVELSQAEKWWGTEADAIRVREVASAVPDPDLSISLRNMPGAVRPGELFAIDRTYAIGNQGLSSGFSISYYWSSDGVVGNDILLGTETIAAGTDTLLGAHSGSSQGFRINQPGDFYILATIDGAEQIEEANENNNTGWLSHRVIVRPCKRITYRIQLALRPGVDVETA